MKILLFCENKYAIDILNPIQEYVTDNHLPHEVQFDIITIVGDNRENAQITHISDAFRPPLRTYR